MKLDLFGRPLHPAYHCIIFMHPLLSLVSLSTWESTYAYSSASIAIIHHFYVFYLKSFVSNVENKQLKPKKNGPILKPSSLRLCTCQGQIVFTLGHQSMFWSRRLQMCVASTLDGCFSMCTHFLWNMKHQITTSWLVYSNHTHNHTIMPHNNMWISYSLSN